MSTGFHWNELLSAGGVISTIEAVWKGEVDNAYSLNRPPGHHAERDEGRGFCVFANIAVAIEHMRAAHGVERIAVVDWDVHHGNGTEHAFYEDPNVLTISLHQAGLYPAESGLVEHTGEGEGEGSTVNVPLPPGSGNGAYEAAAWSTWTSSPTRRRRSNARPRSPRRCRRAANATCSFRCP
jgi:acetoin utilization deacetylase AcuC-like enzyme